ncbi:MAG: putative RNA methyltransferase [Firmicutes bacterium ADurb.Bin248]|nr:MAG: putative RNA methyltransferase [Firmicutes bacterium ADurb.Bin248]HOG00556.1 TrmH family RNA methyltransferase [Clostridia bacterium]HPK16155.1 TrmH family RNA methyltransferase [Clostridia bacterium]
MKTTLKPYKSTDCDSYASGAYAAMELIAARPELVREVLIHPAFAEPENLRLLCVKKGIPAVCGEKPFLRLNQKENTYVLAVFQKREAILAPGEPHVVLVNPADMGNLGTVARTMAGFGFGELAVVTPAADVWHPKTVRASMGALFRVNVARFAGFEAYRAAFPAHKLFPFMPNGALELGRGRRPAEPFTLVFGNEATGLDARFSRIGTSVRIPQTELVDSLNLAVAAAIGMYAFSRG